MRFYGAAEDFIEENKKLVAVMTDGHAFLVHTAALYLKDHGWNITDDVFTGLFQNKYGQAFTAEVYAKILASTQAEETKSLLYRTAIIMGHFTDDEIGVVGSVNPAVPHIHQRSQGLKGVWLQETEKGRFQLSPLVKKLGENLPADLQNQINEALGHAITRKPMLSQTEAYDALLYYWRGKSHVHLSWVLVRVLEFSLSNPAVFFDWGFRFFWYQSPLPAAVPPLFKAMIRVFHLQLAGERAEDLTFLVNDLEQILAKEDVGLLGRSYAELMISHVFLKTDPVKSFRYFLLARPNWQKWQDALPLAGESDIRLDDFFWTSFYSLRTKEAYEAWFGLLKTAEAIPEKEHLDSLEPYVLAAHSLVHLTVLPEGSDATQAIDTLQTIFRSATEAGLPLMAVYAVRYLVAVRGTYTKRLDEAKKLLDENNGVISSKPIYAFLVKEEYGRQLYYARQTEGALTVLSEVVDTAIEKPFLDGVEGCRVYAQLTGEGNLKVADYYIQKALNKALNDASFPEIGRIKLLGEAAVSLWLLKKRVDAFYLLEDAYDRLLKIFQSTEEHQAIIIRLAHFANYIRGEIIDGRPPEKAADGGDYAAPVRGFFFRNNGPLLAGGFYFEERKFIGSTVFEGVFEFLGDYAKARKWALLGIELSLSLPEAKYFPVLYRSLHYIIMDRQYSKAVNLFRYLEEKLANIRKAGAEGKDIGDYRQVKHLLDVADSDNFFFAQVVIPVTITVAHDIVRGRLADDAFPALIENLFNAFSTGRSSTRKPSFFAQPL